MKIAINTSSEMMENNKQGEIMSPQKTFQALQTKEGHSLFFSIGTDNVFYLTREVPGTENGWIKTDLSSVLSEFNNGITIVVKTFMVAQNMTTNNIDIVIAIKGQDQDYIYTALNLLNEDATWSEEIMWSVQGYDDKANPVSKVEVSDIYIAENQNTEYIVVDILKDPSNINKFVDRYYLDPSKKITGQVWNEHDLSANLNAETLRSTLGKKSDQLVEGIYTLGKMNASNELLYTPLYNPFNPKLPPSPSRLVIPQDASALATVKNNPLGTALFVAGNKALYYFAYDQQEDGNSGIIVLQNDLFLNVKALYANATDSEIVVWGLNEAGQIFYTKCPIGRETVSSSWSVPIPILNEVEQIATYLNNTTSNNVIFAHTNGTELIQLTQNPITTLWDRRNIILPSTDINDVLSFTTYTTHIQVSREDNLAADNETVKITSVTPVSVYINNNFAILSPNTPHLITTDATGVITILQETDSVGVVCYKMQLEGSDAIVDVNPMIKIMNTFEKIKSGEDLGSVVVTNADGTSQPLVSSEITAQQKEATAQAIQQFVAASKTVPKDGNIQGKAVMSKSTLSTYKASEFIASANTIWGMNFQGNNYSFHSGEEAMLAFGLQKDTNTNKFALRSMSVEVNDIGDAIESAAGDIFNWVRHAFDEVKNFFIKVIDGVYNFFITIGNELYTFVLDCYNTIVNAVEFVFNMIKVFIEDLIKWVGFLFQWKDILLTHDVLKNVMKRGIENSVDQIDVLKANINKIFDDIQSRIDSWAGLESTTGDLSSKSSQAGPCPGKDDPQSNYGTYHLNNGAAKSSTNTSIINGITSELEQLLNTLSAAVKKEGDIFQNAYNNFKTQVIDQIDTLSIGEILKRSIAIIADILIESVENIIDTTLDIIKILIDGVVQILDATIEIPVLSWLYKKITGNDLSLLDAICLALAIPTTLLYKISKNEAPFPENETTKALISAKNWSDLKNILNPNSKNLNASIKNVETNFTQSKASTDSVTTLQENFMLVMRLTAFCSSFAFIGLSMAKKADPVSKPISILHGICFYTTTAPNLAAGLIRNDDQRWDIIVNEIIYGITAIEKLADIFTYRKDTDPKMALWAEVTKYVDCVLGVAGLVPTFSPLFYGITAQSVTGAITNACWNANRITTPFATEPKVFAGKMILIGFYGVGQYVLYWETLFLNTIENKNKLEHNFS